MTRRTLALTGLATLALTATPALADGGYLHLREANVYMTRHFAPRINGVVTVQPCRRLDAHRASCVATSSRRFEGTVCTFHVTVRKSFAHRRFWWGSTVRSDCELVA